jgi:hypothetical protein
LRKLGGFTKIILIVPLKADLEIMVLGAHTEKLVEQVRALALSQAVDVLDVEWCGKLQQPKNP